MKEENQGPGQFEWWKCVYWLADMQLVLVAYLRWISITGSDVAFIEASESISRLPC